MKKAKYTLIILISALSVKLYAQNPGNNQNYIMETTVRDPGHTNVATLTGLPVHKANRSIQYLDGLGRPLQTVQWQGSPLAKDIVQVKEYDAFGREAKKYLPYPDQGNDGSFKSFGAVSQSVFYNSPATGVISTNKPFGLTVFEPSPLNRIVEQGAPGVDWQPGNGVSGGHTVKLEYLSNSGSEVLLWIVNSSGASATSSYAAGKLFKTTTKDENWVSGRVGTVEEFKDFEGRILLKRIWELENKSLDTYYVYDDLSNLRYVLPPAVNQNGQNPISSFTESDLVFDQFIYGYHYDGRKRQVEKKVPGKSWEYMVYNKLDQIVYTQDAKQHAIGQWNWIKYDVFGRVILTGLENNNTTLRLALQDNYINTMTDPLWEERTGTRTDGYTVRTHPMAGEENVRIIYHTVNYYDDYTAPGLPYNYTGTYSTKTKGLLTATKTKVLGTADQFLWTVNYYDEDGRVVKLYKQHYLSGSVNVANYDEITNVYNFAGDLLTSTRLHHTLTGNTLIATRYEYDHGGGKTKTWEKIGDDNSAEVLLSELSYNELGQLTNKRYGNGIKSSSYGYNERGWLSKSSSPDFEFELKYNTATVPSYNGNIAEQFWGTEGNLSKSYIYSYDKLNRLTSGISNTGNHEKDISYDEMGNLKTLTRDSGIPQAYAYNGNRLNTVTGGANRLYTYDENGNALSDGTNGFIYNNLNLISEVSGPNATTYTYDATGKKLRRITNGVTTDYVDGIQYTSGIIDFIQTEEGLARRNTATEYLYQYNLSDHLGNSRYTFNGNGSKMQSDDYYPFGKTFNSFASGSRNNYLYNGKELEEGLEQYDFGARFYDPVIGRWSVADPLAEKVYSDNPYAFTGNNPVNNTDPNGMETLYGIDARNAFNDLKSQLEQNEASSPGDPPKKNKKGYFSSFFNSLSKGNPFGNTGRTWERWLSSESTLGNDLWSATSSSFWGVASLLDGNTYVNWYEGQKQYWTASSEERAKADADYLNNLVEGSATYAPFGYIASDASVIQATTKTKQFLSFESNGGYGVKMGKFEFMYKNPKVEGGTILSYKSSGGNKFRIDLHRVGNRENIIHYHTNYFNLPLSTHRSFSLTNFGKAVKL